MYVVFLNRLFDSLFLFERISKSDCENVWTYLVNLSLFFLGTEWATNISHLVS